MQLDKSNKVTLVKDSALCHLISHLTKQNINYLITDLSNIDRELFLQTIKNNPRLLSSVNHDLNYLHFNLQLTNNLTVIREVKKQILIGKPAVEKDFPNELYKLSNLEVSALNLVQLLYLQDIEKYDYCLIKNFAKDLTIKDIRRLVTYLRSYAKHSTVRFYLI